MKNRFIQLTSGWIPVSVLLLFTIALVAGQARANLPNELKAAPVPTITTSVNIVLNAEMLRQLESLPLVVDTLLALPLDISVRSAIVLPAGRGEHAQPKTH
jgi:hypothetical protein